ncbi:hypothetical protein TNCV_306031 [Trichonephila clavipes]|nr:hypothetical protein TNCV_306031 [Trichonephila clavipes]
MFAQKNVQPRPIGSKTFPDYRPFNLGRNSDPDNCVINRTHRRDAIEDDQRSGRPISRRTPEIIDKVRNSVVNDRCAALRMMTDSLNINKETSCMDIWAKQKCVLNLFHILHPLSNEKRTLQETSLQPLKTNQTPSSPLSQGMKPETKLQSAE